MDSVRTLPDAGRGLKALCLLAGLAGAMLGGGRAEAAQCGTDILLARLTHPSAGGKIGAASIGAAADNRARTLESEHFLIHYSLRGWYRVHTEPEDSALVRIADSLFATFGAMKDPQRDSATYARMDSMHLPHPAYVRKTAQYFEAARNYYVDKLGMRAPVSGILSKQYKVSASLSRKFPVDIVDAGTADSEFQGETYGVTYPPQELSVTLENDFICRTRLDTQGRISGDSIMSRLGDQVIHNYAADWELGVKVTVYHEFYHAEQFTYVPRITKYNAWYELSATGMEERNAGEVNDYIQYLPCVLNNHDRVALNSIEYGPCTHRPMYGQSIFHQYLSKALDSAFDVRVWDQLGRNGESLQDGLESAFAKYGKTMSALYPDYAYQLFFSGKRFPAPPGGHFSPDRELWPDIALDSIDLNESDSHKEITLPALTFGILKVKWGSKAVTRVLQSKAVTGMMRIHAGASGYEVEQMQGSQFPLGPPHTGDAYYLVLPNPSFTDQATVEIKEADGSFYAFPNPARAEGPAPLYFSQAKGMAFPSQVRIYSEDGRIVQSLDFQSASQVLTWDFKNADKRTVKTGLYYYRLNSEPLKTLVILR
ncbi:MAG: hypothetical protein ABI036_04805 [Fibrobacteria bacterium]